MAMAILEQVWERLANDPRIQIVKIRDIGLPQPYNARFITEILVAPRGDGLYTAEALQELQESLFMEIKLYFSTPFKTASGLMELGEVGLSENILNGEKDEMRMVCVRIFPNAKIASIPPNKKLFGISMEELKRHQDEAITSTP
jgi:hypothetical protein